MDMLTVEKFTAICERFIEADNTGNPCLPRDIAELRALHEDALYEIATISAALQNLVAKLDAIEPHVSNVCAIAQIHGVPYTGPNWADEIAAARAVLAQE
jgi:hypothetical protein